MAAVEAGMQLLVPRQREREHSWPRGEWQLEEEGALPMTLCSSTHWRPLGASAAEVPSRVQGGKEGRTVCVERWTGQEKTQQGVSPSLPWRSVCFAGDTEGTKRFSDTYKWCKNVKMMPSRPGLESTKINLPHNHPYRSVSVTWKLPLSPVLALAWHAVPALPVRLHVLPVKYILLYFVFPKPIVLLVGEDSRLFRT